MGTSPSNNSVGHQQIQIPHIRNVVQELVARGASTDDLALITHYLHSKGTSTESHYKVLCEENFGEVQTSFLDLLPVTFEGIKSARRQNEFTFIDLFAGIGGMRSAFQQVGGRCIFSSEWDKHAQTTYFENFGEVPFGDITQIAPDVIPAHDALVAGFPCQPFSNAGRKLGFEDTRGTLFFDIARIVNHHKPKMILLENVKGFASHDRGRTFATVVQAMEDLGYKVFSQILNASDFGLPQNRERIFIVCVRTVGNRKVDFEFPKPTRKKTLVGDILESRVDPKYVLSDKLWRGHQRRLKEHRARGNGFGYSLFDSKSTRTSTISARYYKDGSEILISTRGNPRKITPREAARLQGFPDSFSIPVSDTQAYKQFGNSVAINVVTAIAKVMVESLL